MSADQLFGLLIAAAATLWISGWVLLGVDAVWGFRFIERYPTFGNLLGAVTKYAWIAIALLVGLHLLINGSRSRFQPGCHIEQNYDGREEVC